MLSRTVNQTTQAPWAKLVWAGVAVLALIQVVAFYRLCTSQVARAQARETMLVEQRNALTDCLEARQRATISSCARQTTSQSGGDPDAGSLAARDLPRARPTQAVFNSAVPVSYVFH